MNNYKERLESKMGVLIGLNAIMAKHGFPKGSGSYLMDGFSLEYDKRTFEKQDLLYRTVSDFEECDVLEIGVYAGHSGLIMMLVEDACVVGIDPCFPFTEPCIDYLNAMFDDRYKLIKGESLEVLPTLTKKYDVVHLDGCHDIHYILDELSIIKDLLSEGGVVVVDDWDGIGPQIPQEYLEEIEILDIADCPNPNAVIRFK